MRYNKRDAKGRFVADSRVIEDEGLIERIKAERDTAIAEADFWRVAYDVLSAKLKSFCVVSIKRKVGFWARLFGRG